MNEQREALDKDFFKAKLIELKYYKHPDGRQLWELDLEELQEIYKVERLKLKTR